MASLSPPPSAPPPASPHYGRNALFALISGASAGLIYEAIYFAVNDHHVRGGFGIAAIVGAVTFLIAFVLNVVFTRLGQRR